MSKASDSFSLPVPLPTAGAVVDHVLASGRWKVEASDGEFFMFSEQTDLFSRLFRHPTKVAIYLHEQSGNETRAEMRGAIFGIGPIQSRRVRKVLRGLRAAIEAEAAIR